MAKKAAPKKTVAKKAVVKKPVVRRPRKIKTPEPMVIETTPETTTDPILN